ncbi:hypothetical protein [Rhizobium leguminosarum]|uniref:hypothetical protein n=1 Tax=Rhizobium leguminosarum TaxID=384 RepID=UPI003F9D9107
MTSPAMTTQERLARLRLILQKIDPPEFEKAAAALISELLGVGIAIAKSGFQHGGDSGPAGRQGRRFRIEAKRYADGTKLDSRALLGEIKQALWRDDALEAWFLITTQEASEQLEIDFLREEEDEGVPIIAIDWKAGEFPALAALCTVSPEIVSRMVSSEAALLAAALVVDAKGRLDELSRALEEWNLGFHSLREKSTTKVLDIWMTPRTAISAIGQNAAGGALPTTIKRSRVSSALDRWWAEQRGTDAPAAVIGWQGAGKTWATLQWTIDNIQAQPIVIVVSSSSAAGMQGVSNTSLKAFLGERLCEITRSREPLHWQRRLERLLKRPIEEGPVLTLIIDGMNQEPAAPWLEMLQVLQDGEFSGRIRVITVTRNLHFTEKMGQMRGLLERPKIVEVDNYDLEVGGELDQRLAAEGLTRKALHSDLIEMARTPRLFDLVIRLRENLVGAERITVHRLLFEYGRDTFGIRNGVFSEEAWKSWLAQVAQDRINGIRSYNLARLGETVGGPHLENKEVFRRLSDIVDGDLLKRSPAGQLELSLTLAAHALGAALLNHLTENAPEPRDAIEVKLNNWLDPIAALDEKAEILRAAVSMVLETGVDGSPNVASVLLFEWLRSQNIPEHHRTEVTLLAASLCGPLLEVIEHSTDTIHKTARLLAVNSIRAIPRDDHGALAIIVRYSQDWLRIASRDLDPPGQRNEEQEAYRAKRQIERVGVDRDGELHVLGHRIVFVRRRYGGPEDTVPSLLEGFPLQPTLPAFETAAVSVAIRHRDSLWNGLKWLCLLNAEDFVETADALKSRAEQFASRTPETGVHPDLGKRVGALLLWLSGDETNEIAASEMNPLLDRPSYEEEYLSDPGKSYYAVEMRHAEMVLLDERIPFWRRLDKTSKFLIDPDFQVPEAFVAELRTQWQDFSPQELDANLGNSPLDHNWERAVPALARFAPDLLAKIVREKLHGYGTRTVEQRYPTAVKSLSHYLLSDEPTRQAARLLRDSSSVEGANEEAYARSRLLILEAQGLSAFESAVLLIEADLEFLSADFDAVFPNLTEKDVDTLVSRYQNGPKKRIDDLILLLSIARAGLSETTWNWLEEVASSPDYKARGVVFEVLYRADAVRFGRALAKWDWRWSPDQNLWSNHFGSLGLAEAGSSLPFDQSVANLAPWLILRTVSRRGGTARDTEIGAAILDSIIRTPTLEVPDLGSEISISAETREFDPFTLSVTMRTDENGNSLAAVRRTNSETQREARNRAADIAVERIATARKSGASLFMQDVHAEDFFPVIEHLPGTITAWLEGVEARTEDFKRRVRLAEGFYVALCEALLNRNPERGASLWRALRQTLRTKFVDRAKIDTLVHMVFRAKNTPDDVRTELFDIANINTDQDLFELALAATMNGEVKWLDRVIEEDERSGEVWRSQRARRLRGLRPGNTLPLPGRWPEGPSLHTPMIRDHENLAARRSEAFAHHWWDRYWKAEDDEEAYAAWQLLYECADRRALIWMRLSEEDTRSASNLNPKRLAHVELNMQDLKSKMEKAFKKSDEEFLGRDVYTGVGPWGKVR